MKTHVSTRGTGLTDELQRKVKALAAGLAEREPRIRLAKFVLEQRGEERSVGAVLVLEGEGTVVRHARALGWDRAFEELSHTFERALESGAD